VDVARVVPFLLDVKPTDLTPPAIKIFNAVTAASKDDIWRLIKSMNAALGDARLEETVLRKTFDRAWAEFEKAVKDVQALAAKEIAEQMSEQRFRPRHVRGNPVPSTRYQPGAAGGNCARRKSRFASDFVATIEDL